MKFAIFFVCIFVIFGLGAADRTDDVDKVDVDAILANERLTKVYTKCLVEAVGCTPDGEKLRVALPGIVSSICGKCDKKQLATSKKIMDTLKNKYPDIYKQLLAKFDPDNTYSPQWEEKWAAEGL